MFHLKNKFRKFSLRKHMCIFRFKSKCAEPSGNDCGLTIYNTLSKSKVPLVTDSNFYLSWYSCGPTVYDVAHIGHASSYMRLDVIRRVLAQWFNVKPIVAIGVTDIDDKIIARSKDLNLDCNKLAKKYELEFFEDMNKLNILEPHFILRVTEHIPEIIEFIQMVMKNGHAYLSSDGCIYFNTKSLPCYGKVTGAPVIQEDQFNGIRMNKADFALWKAAQPGEPSWQSPWSQGRPGWHIECSTMASKIFGNHLDIHTGGLDLAFPHHENEEAQSCAHHNVNQWVNYWIHTGHLLMNGMKMSKSMKNFVPIKTFLTEHTADHLRMLCLLTHYRTSIDYNENVMGKAVALINKFTSFLSDARSYCHGSWSLGNVSSSELFEAISSTEKEVRKCLSDDINTAQTITHLENFVKLGNSMLHAEKPEGTAKEVVAMAKAIDFLRDSLHSLGLFLSDNKQSESQLSKYVIDKSGSFRNDIRQIALASKDKTLRNQLLQACDTFRSDLNATNIAVKDTIKASTDKK